MNKKNVLTLDDAKAIAAAAEAEATRNNWPVAIAIVDDGAHLVHLLRLDETQFGSVEVAIQKARAAIAFRRPTKVWEEHVAAGSIRYLGLPGTLPIEGWFADHGGRTVHRRRGSKRCALSSRCADCPGRAGCALQKYLRRLLDLGEPLNRSSLVSED